MKYSWHFILWLSKRSFVFFCVLSDKVWRHSYLRRGSVCYLLGSYWGEPSRRPASHQTQADPGLVWTWLWRSRILYCLNFSLHLSNECEHLKTEWVLCVSAWLLSMPLTAQCLQIVFDECHKAKNATSTKMGKAVLQLQNKLPLARVVYASATGENFPKISFQPRGIVWFKGCVI